MPTRETGGASMPDASSWWAIREDRPEQSTTRSARSTSPSTTTPVTRPRHGLDPVDQDAVAQGHAGQGRDPAPHHLLEQRPGQAEHRPAPVAPVR